MDLTGEQWKVVKPLIPIPRTNAGGRGRPRRDDCEILNGNLWIMRTGAPWHDLPDRYPSYQTCHRRFQEWVRSGVFAGILKALVKDMKERGGLDVDCIGIPIRRDLSECFIDGTFIIAKRGAKGWERPSEGKVGSSWQWHPDKSGFLSPYPLEVLRRMK